MKSYFIIYPIIWLVSGFIGFFIFYKDKEKLNYGNLIAFILCGSFSFALSLLKLVAEIDYPDFKNPFFRKK